MFYILMNFLIVIMVIGVIVVVSVFEPYAELFFVWLMVFCRDKRFLTIIKKNLYDHRARNSKAFIMILLSVTSLIACSIIFSTLSLTSVQVLCIKNGADVIAVSKDFNSPLDEKKISSFLDKLRGSIVEEYAYQSFSLRSYPHISSNEVLESAIGYTYTVPIVAVSKEYLNTVFPEFIVENSRDMNYQYNLTVDGKYDVVGSMYDSPPVSSRHSSQMIATGLWTKSLARNVSEKLFNIIPVILASSITETIGEAAGSRLLVDFSYTLANGVISTKFELSVRALMDRLSGFYGISPFFSRNEPGRALVPQSFFKKLLAPWKVEFSDASDIMSSQNSFTRIKQEKLFVRLCKNVSRKDRFVFVNDLRALLDSDTQTASNTLTAIENSASVRKLIMYFFYLSSFLCICLSTFMLSIVFTANVRLNSRVIGILRSLGCKKWELIRITLYEVLSIIFSAFIFGILMGIAVGSTVGYQISSLLVLPFTFELPYSLIAVIFFSCIFSGVFVTVFSLFFVNKDNISAVVK